MAANWQEYLAQSVAPTPMSERAMKGTFFPLEGVDPRAGSSKTRPAPKNPKGTWESAETTPELLNPENWQRTSKPRGHIKRVGKGSTSASRGEIYADDVSVNPGMDDPGNPWDDGYNSAMLFSGMVGDSASSGRTRLRRKK